MENSFPSCPIPVNAHKTWPYHQYYCGEQDQEKRRNGQGQNHWSGAESLEWYTGKFVRDMMHGDGEYRWRYLGSEGAFITYEGPFYGNSMHGYGVLSYPDGRVFNGLFYHNMRWGPGIETHSNLQESVGLWHGNQLVRLMWRPNAPSITLDLNTSLAAKTCVEPYRSLLTTRIKTIGEVNSAIELLKQSGADPISASENWTKLYPKYCTDLASQLCHNELFDYEYYKNNIFELEEVDTIPECNDQDFLDELDRLSSATYYSWNNGVTMVSIMKHCFKHEKQRSRSGIDLTTLLTGPRNRYKTAAKHEIECRSLILASYLGKLRNVVQLVNENNVHPDVADILGNTPLMYATYGNQTDVIHFLVEAGANVNSFNDSCCTALGLALVKFTCGSRDIAASGMIQALLPPPSVAAEVPPVPNSKPVEWHITRDLFVQSAERLATTTKTISLKKANKSTIQLDTGPKERKKSNTIDIAAQSREKKRIDASTNTIVTETFDDEPNDMTEETNEQRIFHDMNKEFSIKVSDAFNSKTVVSPVPYLFEVTDMVKAADMIKEHKSSMTWHSKPLAASKSVKDTVTKPTREVTRQDSEYTTSEQSVDEEKIQMLNEIMSTILQLLMDGADPRLARCPQPALRVALASGSRELVRLLVKYGADINEVYLNDSNLTLLDMAISQPLTFENLAQTRAILECGARTDHRLEYPASTDPKVPGPTLLHAVLAKNTENNREEEIRCQLLELLLEYNCCALTQFKGCSAIEVAMMKDTILFDIFVKSPKVDPNAVINDQNQTILIKMFTPHFCSIVPISERLQILTNLMLYGADPLLECQDGDKKYTSFFEFARQILKTTNEGISKHATNDKTDVKGKKRNEKAKEITEKQSKPATKMDDMKDFKQALDLVNNCARILHVRWIQAQLLKELIQVVIKYEHRQWNMIVPEYRHKKACGLWLSCPRSLEIWDILKSNKKKNINDRRILKHVLCIVHFNSNRSKSTFKRPLTAEERGTIENDVCCILREHKIAANMTTEPMNLTKPYVTPELAVGADIKFQVCFECHLPFEEEKIMCINCKQVSFCSHDCMKMNVEINGGTHPCSEYLKNKYFSSPTESVSQSDFII